ncbi:3-dehydroquinate synthase [Chlamydia sp. 17-3921]|uniref:3-dehydroquinate synthase n=1 Tax=Chlamydia sp. 17-3921 TaxID=2675798 RepID=UPI001917F9FD|nr:3-dehydroquinate synthase [Chlamydia sp. 17-3921]
MINTIITQPHSAKLVNKFFTKKLFSSISIAYPVVIITDHNIEHLVLPPVLDYMKSLGYEVILLSFPPGEQQKNWENFISLQNQLVEQGISTGSSVLGFGGGTVLDMTGFLASTYCRGMQLYLIPTTITAMIDACIGGKNGINFRGLKNRLGTFYLPKDVWICPEFLSTLSRQEWHYGIAEAIKHGCIADVYLWEFLDSHSSTLFSSPQILGEFIKRNCQIKAAITIEDPQDRNRRKILNFGHSIAHAIETLSKGYVNHGQAVSIGMMVEMKLSLISGVMKNSQLLDQLCTLLKKFDLPTTFEDLRTIIPQHLQKNFYHPENIIHTLGYDKKNLSKKALRIVMIEHLGRAASFEGAYCTSPNKEILYKVLQDECNLMCHY